jgi:hypothetical protein
VTTSQRNTFDYKEVQLLRHFVTRILTRAFDEYDLYGLFILLREHAPEATPVRELGHFMAHRVRDRGEFLQFLEGQRVRIEMLSRADDPRPGLDFIHAALSGEGVYRESDVLIALNDILGPSGFACLPLDLAGDILVCTMSLLQDVRFIDKQLVEVGKFFFIITKNRVGLLGRIQLSDGEFVLVPVLSTENRYYHFEPRTPEEIGLLPNTALVVVRRFGALQFDSI